MQEFDHYLDRLEELSQRCAVDSQEGVVVASYVGLVPRYRFELSVDARLTRELTPLKEFGLKFIDAGVTDEAQLFEELGIESGCGRRLLQGLLTANQAEIASAKGATILALTERGVSDLKSHREEHWLRESLETDYDPVLGAFSAKTAARPLAGWDRRWKRGFVLPAADVAFDLAKLNEKEVRVELLRCLNKPGEGRGLDGQTLFEAVRVLDIQSQEVVFQPVPVLIYGNERNKLEPVIYASWTGSAEYRLFDHEQALKRALLAETLWLPDCQEVPRQRPTIFGKIDRRLVDKQEKKLNSALKAVQSKRNVIDNLREEEVPDDHALESAKAALAKAEQAVKADSVVKALGHETLRIIDTNEHRVVLERCFREATESVLIISPWLRHNAVNSFLMSRIEECLGRGVMVGIGYGIDDVTDERTNAVVARLQTFSSKPNFHLKNVGNSHEKILVCDSRYAIVTSFNWLSFKPDAKRAVRRETGIYVESPKLVGDLRKTTLELIGIEPDPAPGPAARPL